jgi:predicted O-methyltransferase YrrM
MADNIEWTPDQLIAMSVSYWQACTIHAAVKLDIFSIIGDECLREGQIAQRFDADARGTKMLVNALAAMGLLAIKNGLYSNTTFSKSFLVKQSPNFIGHIVLHHHNMVETWALLDQAVKSGRPVRKRTVGEEEDRESFLLGMFNMAMRIAPGLVTRIDLTGKRRLLDLGGGPGTYAIHFCLENPELEATVYDLPTTRSYAEKTINKFGLSDRVAFAAGNYLTDDIRGSYDVAWLSHIIHSEGPDAGKTIVEKASSVLDPGGLILIHEFILDDTLDGPVFPALFSLNMLVNTERGQSYSEGGIMEVLKSAGFGRIKRLPFKGPNDSGIITGIKQ